MPAVDISEQLQAKVVDAFENNTPLNIQGGDTKSFYGRKTSAEILSLKEHQGIINYEPTELVITALAGTPLNDIEQNLSDNNQILAFEPPYYGDNATLGGTIACNFSGPRRPYTGAARDFVLGTRIINGKGEILSFGGEVMKNVAGYDVSRLMTGAMGTLGVILDVSLKVLPKPEAEITLQQESNINDALKKMTAWSRTNLPISASCFYNSSLYIRLSSTESAINNAKNIVGGDTLNDADSFWLSVKEHQHDFFNQGKPLWRLSIAANLPAISLQGEQLIEWGGALRWLSSDEPEEKIRSITKSLNGHATLFRSNENSTDTFQTLEPALFKIHQNLKKAFDPKGILNPGRMYKDL